MEKSKIIFCHYCGKEIEVHIYSANKQSCDECKAKGLFIKDGRSDKTAIEKRQETNIKKFGVPYPAKNHEIKNKIKETNIKRRGVSWVFQDKEVQKKIEKTNLKKYGHTNPASSEQIKQKIYKKFIDKRKEHVKKHLKENLNLEILSDYQNQNEQLKLKCLKCNHVFEETYFNIYQRMYPCPKCRPKDYHSSSYEKEIYQFLKKYLTDDILLNNREIITPKELDIYIPSKKIAIEINGVRWHSDKYEVNKFYHINKLITCLEKGIRLIHIFEDEWLYKKEIVKARLKQIIGINDNIRIHARKCEIKEIDSKMKNVFLEKYHIQGKDNSKVKLGAFYNNKLVAVMTFSHGNIAKGSQLTEGVWELNRFCCNYNFHVPGIASKLLTYFKRNYEWQEIFSYADRRWSIGNVYERLGFQFDCFTPINYWYVRGNKRIHRFNLRKKPDEPKNITEWELRRKEGYDRIWDCGHLKYVMKKGK